MRSDIKTAMRAKDVHRLSVLRGFLAAADGASKENPNAMETENKVLALLMKQAKVSTAAAADFEAANRNDLKDKEEAQLGILQEYMRLIPTVPEDVISEAVEDIVSRLRSDGGKINHGNVMRHLTGRTGVFADKPVNTESVLRIVAQKLEEPHDRPT